MIKTIAPAPPLVNTYILIDNKNLNEFQNIGQDFVHFLKKSGIR